MLVAYRAAVFALLKNFQPANKSYVAVVVFFLALVTLMCHFITLQRLVVALGGACLYSFLLLIYFQYCNYFSALLLLLYYTLLTN